MSWLGTTIKLIGGQLGAIAAFFLLWVWLKPDMVSTSVRERKNSWLVLAIATFVWGSIRFSYAVSRRYEMPLLLPAILLVSGGVIAMIAAIRKLLGNNTTSTVLGGLLLLIAMIAHYPSDNKQYLRFFAENLRYHLQEHPGPSIFYSINGRGKIILYYADRQRVKTTFRAYESEHLTAEQRQKILNDIYIARKKFPEVYVFLKYDRSQGNWLQRDATTLWQNFPFETLSWHEEPRQCYILYRYRENDKERKNLGDSLQLTLPSTFQWITGEALTLYFDNMVLTPDLRDYVFRVNSKVGQSGQRQWHCPATQLRLGKLEWQLSIDNGHNEILAMDDMPLVVISPRKNAPAKKLLLVGGLTLEQTQLAQQVQVTLRKHEIPVTLTGSHSGLGRQNPEALHEGHDSWNWSRYISEYRLTPEYRNGKLWGSPFLYAGANGKPELNIARYLQKIRSIPDVVIFIWELPQGVHGSILDITTETAAECAALDQLIEAFRSCNPAVRIGIMPPLPPAGSQDAFAVYGNLSRWDYRMRQHAAVRHLLQRYGNRQKAGVDILPGYLVIDPDHDFRRYGTAGQSHPLLLDKRGTQALATLIAAWVNGALPETSAIQKP